MAGGKTSPSAASAAAASRKEGGAREAALSSGRNRWTWGAAGQAAKARAQPLAAAGSSRGRGAPN
eukprot:448055-Pyramimonas_sp.AAC.1